MSAQDDLRLLGGMADELNAGVYSGNGEQRLRLTTTNTGWKLVGLINRLWRELVENRSMRAFEQQRHAAAENALRDDIERLTDALEEKR